MVDVRLVQLTEGGSVTPGETLGTVYPPNVGINKTKHYISTSQQDTSFVDTACVETNMGRERDRGRASVQNI